MSARTALLSAILLAAVWQPGHAHALAKFKLVEQSGFRDPTPARPEGGNLGTTLGEQRRLLMEHALSIWGELLESTVPIAVQVGFEDLGCPPPGPDGTRAVTLAGAMSTSWHPLPAPSLGLDKVLYPSALADRIVGYDLRPGEPDIVVYVNDVLDAGKCDGGRRFYYGFDGARDGRQDLLGTVLHELAHGLGFSSEVDVQTGALEMELGLDVFSAHVHDLDLGRSWGALSDSERARSVRNVRRLIFDGPETQRAAQSYLTRGAPSLTFAPPIASFSDTVGDVGFARNPATGPVRGPVVVTDMRTLCGGPSGELEGAVVLFELDPEACSGRLPVDQLAQAGAVGALLVMPSVAELPALPLDIPARRAVSMPMLTVSVPDAVSIAAAASRQQVVATLGGQADRAIGADEQSRPFLYASAPALRGSSISHFDPLTRPDLLMEPFSSESTKHDLDLTVAVMRDLGWITLCGNGKLDEGEECDEGAANSDAPGVSCRTTCRRPFCGDGVQDQAEACDQGKDNSDARPGACRLSCAPARCGDGVVDPGEQCDAPGGDCTPTCTPTTIAPWVTDAPALAGGDASNGCSTGADRPASPSSLPTLLFGLALIALGRRLRIRRS